QQYDEKNICRMVYDALNVLMAMDIISKDRKEIQWKGLPNSNLNDVHELKREHLAVRSRIDKKAAYLKELHDKILFMEQKAQPNEKERRKIQTYNHIDQCPELQHWLKQDSDCNQQHRQSSIAAASNMLIIVISDSTFWNITFPTQNTSRYNDAYGLIDNEAPLDSPFSTLYNRLVSSSRWLDVIKGVFRIVSFKSGNGYSKNGQKQGKK
nr:transcription factor-like protein DPB isoform X1 [Tanacetum cinerariifolium]